MERKKLQGGFVIVLFCCTLFAFLFQAKLEFLHELELRTWDWRQALVQDPTRADTRIKLIVVDQASLDFLEREYSLTWPIPRELYIPVITFLRHARAKGLAFDLLFTESSAQSVSGDEEFAKNSPTVTSDGRLPVIHALTGGSTPRSAAEDKLELLRARSQQDSAEKPWLKEFADAIPSTSLRSLTLPIPELLSQSSALGSVAAAPDSDGVFRRTRPLYEFASLPILSLPFALYAETERKLPQDLSRLLDADRSLSVRLHGGSGTYKTYSFQEVLQAEVRRREGLEPGIKLSEFESAWVIFGVTAPGLLDFRPTSLERQGNGVEFVASVLDNLANDDFIRTLPTSLALVFGCLCIFLVTLQALRGGRPRAQALRIAFAYLIPISVAIGAALAGWWMPLVLPVLGCTLAAFLAIGLQYSIEGKQHQFMRRAFQHYVSPELVEEIVKNPRALSLGGERKELSIFFSDIVGFTAISEKLEATELVAFLNEYLTLVSDIIQTNAGTVDKFVGDAVVAFWNAPLPIDNHAARALETAIECQRALTKIAPDFLERYGVQVETRIGLHTDRVSVGNFGSRSRFNYTVIGDAANLASRLEGANKFFGTAILFSEQLMQNLAPGLPYRRIGSVTVLGKSEPVTIYEPLFSDAQAICNTGALEVFEAGLKHFELGQRREAVAKFAALPEDPVARAYIRRIEREQGLPAPSPHWSFSEK